MTKVFKVPWAAWREPKYLELKFPDSWDVTSCRMEGADAKAIKENEIKSAILNPIGTKRLVDLARGKESVIIVIDDMTRTTPAYKILPFIFEELNDAGITE
ncbi:MAG: lactate racemase domain-containing protein [Promethearchaeota archaeon]